MAHRAVKIELTAADRKHGMTLAELQTFVKAADATDFPYSEATKVTVTTGWRQQIQKLAIENTSYRDEPEGEVPSAVD